MRGAVIFVYGKRNYYQGDILQLYIAGQALGLSVVRLSSGLRCAVINLKYNALTYALLDTMIDKI